LRQNKREEPLLIKEDMVIKLKRTKLSRIGNTHMMFKGSLSLRTQLRSLSFDISFCSHIEDINWSDRFFSRRLEGFLS